MVVDTSILLAVFFNEDHAGWALDRLQENEPRLRMSTVNYAEALILIQDRQPHLFAELRQAIEGFRLPQSQARERTVRSIRCAAA